MGSLHDPLQLMAPFINNLKLVYRDICRVKMPRDEKIPENMMNRIIEALSYFFKTETIEFERKVVFDGSKDIVGISVVVRQLYPIKGLFTGCCATSPSW